MSILDTRQASRAIADTEPTRLAQTLASPWLTLGLALFAVGLPIALAGAACLALERLGVFVEPAFDSSSK